MVDAYQNFYILKGTYFLKDYVKGYEENAVMAMQPNAWMTKWLFQSWISHFIGSLKKGPGIDLNNRHLLILDGHNSHVTLEVVTLAMNSGLDIVSLPSHTSHALQPLDVSYFKPFKSAFRQIRDSWTLVNKGRKVEKQDLCEWTAAALLRALSSKNIRSGFRKTSIWPLNAEAVRTQMLPSEGFEEGQEGSQEAYDSSGSKEEGDLNSRVSCRSREAGSPRSHPGGADRGPRPSDPEGGPWGEELQGAGVGERASREARSSLDQGRSCSDVAECSRHFYVDVPNPEESNYDANDQYVAIDPAFRAQLQTGNEGDISEFLAFPELIPAKKRKRQQPLPDYTHSRILTSREYITGLEQVLAQKEAAAAAARRKKEEKDATKEQKKMDKEQLQKQKEDRAKERATRKTAKDLERLEKVAAAELRGHRRRGAAARADEAASGDPAGGASSRGCRVQGAANCTCTQLQGGERTYCKICDAGRRSQRQWVSSHRSFVVSGAQGSSRLGDLKSFAPGQRQQRLAPRP
jgi:hypothetical protein